MILAFVLAAVVPAPPETGIAPSNDEIVVIGERMRRLKLVTKTDKKTGVKRCVFKRRSGDPALDRLFCNALLACAKTVTSEKQMTPCLAPYLDEYTRMLAERKASP
ncbi:hypothetical protein [Reyranella sp.]|uniref:hypothetical protein n=1 Tax=Reyranella sp. TaxID=1929291 RepID=UPI002627BE64|nr:hypothetical protein [Reyranella sp.]